METLANENSLKKKSWENKVNFKEEIYRHLVYQMFNWKNQEERHGNRATISQLALDSDYLPWKKDKHILL